MCLLALAGAHVVRGGGCVVDFQIRSADIGKCLVQSSSLYVGGAVNLLELPKNSKCGWFNRPFEGT